jgi:hypothetical protein
VGTGESEARYKEISSGAPPEFFSRGKGYGPEDVHNPCKLCFENYVVKHNCNITLFATACIYI